LISAVIGIAIGHVFYYFSIARLGVAVTAGVLQLQPFLVAIASLILFNEVLTGWQWLGGTVAVCGAMLMLGVQWKLSQKAPALENPVEIAEGESGS
jgi:drug/metabolite transporter (DMT)-like permease